MKKLLAMLLCLTMIVGVLAACGGGSTTSSTTETTSTTSSAADTTDTTESTAEPTTDVVNSTNPGTTLPIVTEPVTISIAKERHMLDTTKSYNEKAAFVNITEETGLTLEFIELAAGTSGEKVPLMLAGGDMPDVFWALLSDAQILQNESQLVALEDLIPTYAPNCLATYEQLGTDWKLISTTPSGHIYGMLGRYESLFENTGDGIQIMNTRWLENVGLSVPTNLDEYVEVLRAFKSQDANGNGDPNDEVPYCFAEDMWCAGIANDEGMFGIGNGQGGWSGASQPWYSIRDGKVEASANTDAYKDYLNWEHMLYSEGLIDAEGFSQNTEVFSNKIKNDQVGTYFCWTALEYLSSEQEKEWTVVPTMAYYDDVTPVGSGEIDRSTIQKNKWVITAECEHPEAALRLWDYLARDTESKMTVAMGEKGILWDEYPDGGYYFVVPDNTTPEFTFEHMKYTYGTVNDPPLMTKAETPKNDGEISPAAALRDQMVEQVNEYYIPKSGQLPQIYVTPEAIDDRTFIETDLLAYLRQFRAQAIMDGFTDADWDAYCKQLEALNYAGWLQWYQDYIDGNL